MLSYSLPLARCADLIEVGLTDYSDGEGAELEMTERKRRGAGRPPASALEEHKEAILEAATQTFLEHGFSDASIAEIARRAGASKTTLYSLYPSKQELYLALLQRRVDRGVLPIVTDALLWDAPVEETLMRLATRILMWVSGEEATKLYRLIVAESERFPKLGEALWESGPERGRTVLRRYFDRLVNEGVLDIPDTDVAALHFQGAVLGMVIVRRGLNLDSLMETDVKTQAWIQQAVTAFVRGYARTATSS